MVNDPFELIQYLNYAGIVFKESGDELALQRCPYCETNEKGNFAHFYFNKHKHTFYCHKCTERGNLYRFKIDRGDFDSITKSGKHIEYKRPENPDQFKRTETSFLDWYTKERGIDQQIVAAYEIGYFKKEIEGNKKDFVVYHYFNEKKELINRKFRSMDKKHMWTEKDAERVYYGLQFIDYTNPVLHVCEGEDDCHALRQIGLDNVVSVPFGANNYSTQMEIVNSKFEKIYMFFDNDEIGQQGAKKFAEKAGLWKCWNVILPFKDARECLKEGIDIFKINIEMNKSKQFRHSEIIKIGDMKTEFLDYLYNSKQLLGYMTPSQEFNKILGGIRMSELTVLTGHTGHGKTTLADNIAVWMESAGLPTMTMAFENKITEIFKKYVEIISGEKIISYGEGQTFINKSMEWTSHAIDIMNNHNYYFLNKSVSNKNGYFTIENIADIIEYCVKFYDIKFFVIDHLHYFLKLSDAKNPVLKIDETIRTIKQWTDKYNIHIILIAHPHMTSDDKDGKSSKLGLNSLKGASSIAQECDNFITVCKNNDEETGELFTSIEVLKNRSYGKTGQFLLRVKDNGNTMLPISIHKQEREVVKENDKW